MGWGGGGGGRRWDGIFDPLTVTTSVMLIW